MAQIKAARVFQGLKSGHLRWPILTLLFLSTVNNYLDRQVFSVLASTITGELGLSNTAYATIVNAFKLGVVLGSFFAGPLMDKFGARKGFVYSVVLWSIAGGFTAAATAIAAFCVMHWPFESGLTMTAAGLAVFCVLRFVLGVGESGNWPASGKAVAEWFPAKERAFAMGFFNSGVAIGAICAPALVVLFVKMTGNWRWAFLVSALLGVPWIYYWLKFYYPSRQHPKITKEELDLIDSDRIKGGAKKKVYGVLRKPAFWGLFAARFIISPVWFFIAYWVFKYLTDEFGFNLKDYALFAWIPFATSAVGNLLGGYCSGKLIARGVSTVKARKIMMAAGAAMMATCVFTAYTHIWWLALALISFLTFAWGIWVANMLGLMADTFASNEIGTVMSWTTLGQYAGSFIFMWYIGYALDNFDMGYVPVFIVAAALPIVGHIFTLILNREDKQVEMS